MIVPVFLILSDTLDIIHLYVLSILLIKNCCVIIIRTSIELGLKLGLGHLDFYFKEFSDYIVCLFFYSILLFFQIPEALYKVWQFIFCILYRLQIIFPNLSLVPEICL